MSDPTDTADLAAGAEHAVDAAPAEPFKPEHVQVGVIHQVTDRYGRDRFEIMLDARIVDVGHKLLAALSATEVTSTHGVTLPTP